MPIEIVMWNQEKLIFSQNWYIREKAVSHLLNFFGGRIGGGQRGILIFSLKGISFLAPKAGAKSIWADSDCAVL